METETKYVQNLKMVVERFAKPCLSSVDIPEEQSKSLFQNIEAICSFHERFLEELKVEQEKETLDGVINVFLKHSDFFKVYVDYIIGFSNANHTHNTLSTISKAYVAILDEARKSEDCRLDIMSYLIMPVQRIPRYELLLQELEKNLDPDASKLSLKWASSDQSSPTLTVSKVKLRNGSKISSKSSNPASRRTVSSGDKVGKAKTPVKDRRAKATSLTVETLGTRAPIPKELRCLTPNASPRRFSKGTRSPQGT